MLELDVHLAVGGVAVLGPPVLHLAAAGELKGRADGLFIRLFSFSRTEEHCNNATLSAIFILTNVGRINNSDFLLSVPQMLWSNDEGPLRPLWPII